jgi:Rrf2 family protein
MKLSTRSRYGTRLVLELAIKFEEGPVYLKDISRSQGISLKYLGQLVIPLKMAGIINSSRGAHGGYFLAKDPETIRLSEIINILEGPIGIVDCINDKNACDRYKTCSVRFFWEEINSNFYRSLEGITLKDMVKHYNDTNI